MDGHALYMKTLAEFSRVIAEAEKQLEDEARNHAEAVRIHELKMSQLKADVESANVAKFHVAKAYREYSESIAKAERTISKSRRTRATAAKSTAPEGDNA